MEETAPLSESVGETIGAEGEAALASVAEPEASSSQAEAGAPVKKSKTWIAE